jgi:drug/metabolite transporter (DMT)-like permease
MFSALGVLAFSLSFTATRAAMASFGAVTVGVGRAAIAGVLAMAWLAYGRAERPRGAALGSLAVVALGVVLGFPLLSALSLREVSASHGAIVCGLAPTLTALFATLRAGERPSKRFWLASLLGTAATLLFALTRTHGPPSSADALLLVGVVLVALGYAEGGRLARTLGGPTVICWALVLAWPVSAPVGLWAALAETRPAAVVSAASLAGFAYISIVSMLLGFFAWYRGIARFGVARASQLQLAQGPLGALWSHWLLGDALTGGHALTSAFVISCAVVASRSRVDPR